MDFKGYYSIIPAHVRYDKDLTPNAKLLYAEITSLCNEKGYCWANNSYFAELYGVTTVSISKWIKALVEKGYISTEIEYKEGSKEILKRYIRIINDPIKEMFNTPQRKVNAPLKEKFKDNNKNIILNTNNNIYIVEIKEIIEYLNEKAGTKYKPTTQKTRDIIKARLKEGFTVEDFKTVIDKKVAEWKGTEWEKFLRPQTLFGTKFEGYLNQNIIKRNKEETFKYENDYEYYSEEEIERIMNG
ncbi:conserved phage C-terminal domain-containing protein [Anaerofustis sp.]|uniref:conserved phage C-terminal domain-containing protein n=1 Tax=Anaerofustis sp. TaxID=1872517 RepID=UPI0025B7CAC4|nr:conserved phage C-terminal domain-containing protein [Anaerofustis sp.]